MVIWWIMKMSVGAFVCAAITYCLLPSTPDSRPGTPSAEPSPAGGSETAREIELSTVVSRNEAQTVSRRMLDEFYEEKNSNPSLELRHWLRKRYPSVAREVYA